MTNTEISWNVNENGAELSPARLESLWLAAGAGASQDLLLEIRDSLRLPQGYDRLASPSPRRHEPRPGLGPQRPRCNGGVGRAHRWRLPGGPRSLDRRG